MQLIVIILDDQDADKVISAVIDRGFRVTRVSSTGGLVSPGSSTLFIGVNNEDVAHINELISPIAMKRPGVVPYAYANPGNASVASFMEVEVGGFLSFVLDVDHFEQV
jgi:uncharacterized protein YaaQ